MILSFFLKQESKKKAKGMSDEKVIVRRRRRAMKTEETREEKEEREKKERQREREKEKEYELLDIELNSVAISEKKKNFEAIDFIITNQGQKREYTQHRARFLPQVKWGQRKLILTALQFFNLYWDPEKVPTPTCVYVGASPGITVNVAEILYPMIKWELYDPEDMNRAMPKENVIFHQELFTDADVSKYQNRNDILFISDIRNKDYKLMSQLEDKEKRGKYVSKEEKRKMREKGEEIVMTDMLRQQQWVIDINPVAAQLKFRLPYIYNPDTDEGLFPYLQGVIYPQPYIGKHSSECRLVPTRNKDDKYYLREWNSHDYESQLSYHNEEIRDYRKTTYNNPFTDTNDNISPGDNPELLNDWDSHCELKIIMDYLKKTGRKVSKENCLKISEFITSEINRVREGDLIKTVSLLRFQQTPIESDEAV